MFGRFNLLFLFQVESLRASVVQKDLYIADLLDRIAIVECEVKAMGKLGGCAFALNLRTTHRMVG